MRIDKVDTTEAVYHSIRETAKLTGLAEYFLRQRYKAGILPGIQVGKKFMVNVPSLMQQLNTAVGEVRTDEC